MLELIYVLVAFLLLMIVLTFSVVGTVLLLRKKPTKDNKQVLIKQLQQTDEMIAEDTNAALEALLGRIEAIEDRLEKDETVIKGFKK
jgi:hypothetical protein